MFTTTPTTAPSPARLGRWKRTTVLTPHDRIERYLDVAARQPQPVSAFTFSALNLR